MSKFIRVRYKGVYTKPEGNQIWLNLDKIISVDEVGRGVNCEDDSFYVINEEDMPTLIEALRGGTE